MDNLDESSQPTDMLFDIFMQASQDVNAKKMANANDKIPVVPYATLPNQPFSQFDINKLDSDIVFDKQLGNRSVCYYGSYPYSYATISHKSRKIPASGNYLCKILDHLHNIMPDLRYNSILVTKYQSGQSSLGFHADNEAEIVQDSTIVTISLGQTRSITFRESTNTRKTLNTH